MNQSDFVKFTDIMQLVAEQYSKTPSDGLISLYWQGLKNYDFLAVQDAIGRHLANTDTGQFMPKIADIIRMMSGSSLDAALSAWAKVDRAVRHVGTYESVVFDDPLIHSVLHDMGGWVGFGTKTEDEWPFVAREFENRYRGFKARSEIPPYPPKMVGIAELHNGQSGFKVASPMLIGNSEIAQRVMDGGAKKPILGISRAKDALPSLLKLVKE